MASLNKRTEEFELFYSSQYRTVPLNSHFYKRDNKSLVRLKYIAGFQSIFSILMKYPKGKFWQWLKSIPSWTACSSLEYNSLNMTTFQMIKDFFFCFWSELYIIFDWRQRIWFSTRRKFFILSAQKNQRQNKTKECLETQNIISQASKNIQVKTKQDPSPNYLVHLWISTN